MKTDPGSVAVARPGASHAADPSAASDTASRHVRHAIAFLALAWAMISGPVTSLAHEVSGPSARVIQRGRLLRIELRVDLAAIVARHAPVAVGTQPPPVEMLPALPEEAVGPMIEAASAALRDEVRVSLDGERVAPERVALPSAAEVRRLARDRVESGHTLPGDGAPAPVVVEVLLPRSSGELAFSFGEEIGPLTVAFSRPEVRWLGSGEAMTVPAGCDSAR